MNTKFICSIHGLEIDSGQINLTRYGLQINNDSAFIEEFYIDEVKRIVGIAQYENSIQWKSYLCNEFDAPPEFNGKQVVSYLLKTSKYLANALWLIKDNSARFQTGHLRNINGILLTVHSNVIDGFYSNCLGERDTIKFSHDELKLAGQLFEFFYGLGYLEKENTQFTRTHSNMNRVTRAYYFLDSARTDFDIGTKVSMYCSAFECLFSVATTELRHRLSETIAHFIGSDKDEKRKIYEQMKTIYDLRSSITHGSGINKKLTNNDAETLKEIVTNCDAILRSCFFKIATNQDIFDFYLRNNTDEISGALTDLIFQ